MYSLAYRLFATVFFCIVPAVQPSTKKYPRYSDALRFNVIKGLGSYCLEDNHKYWRVFYDIDSALLSKRDAARPQSVRLSHRLRQQSGEWSPVAGLGSSASSPIAAGALGVERYCGEAADRAATAVGGCDSAPPRVVAGARVQPAQGAVRSAAQMV